MFQGRTTVEKLELATDYISLAKAKQHLRVTSSTDDAYIADLIDAAFAIASKYVGYNLIKSRVKYGFDSLVGQVALTNTKQGTIIPSGNFLRLYSRVIELENLYYVDENNAVQELPSGDFFTKPVPMSDYGLSIFIENAPTDLTDDNIRYIAEFTEGFEVDNFPNDLVIGILLLVAQYYDNRQSIVVGVSHSAMTYNHEYIFDPYKVPQIF